MTDSPTPSPPLVDLETSPVEPKKDRKFKYEEKLENERLELQLAQQSAEHHDSLIWQITGVFMALQVALIAIAAFAIDKHIWVAGLLVGILGVCCCLAQWDLAGQHREIKVMKYNRAKKLEQLLEIELHGPTEIVAKRWGVYVAVPIVLGLGWVGTAIISACEWWSAG